MCPTPLERLADMAHTVLTPPPTARSRRPVGARLDGGTPSLPTAPAARLQPFTVGALGNFPYYWRDPTSGAFNQRTYDWISANLKSRSYPPELAGRFTNEFISALGSISYSLSTADQQKLEQAHASATKQQQALLTAWKDATGSIPPPAAGLQPIGVILHEIAMTWADPPTTLQAIQTSPDLNALLNKMPSYGASIRPVLVQYLNALGGSISLENAVSMNTGYLVRALNAVQQPSPENGGIQTTNGELLPAYTITPSVATIEKGLRTSKQRVRLEMVVRRISPTKYTIEGTSAPVNTRDFLTLSASGSSSDLLAGIVQADQPVHISSLYEGVTMVRYGPVPFNKATGSYWYWTNPIEGAIRNGTKDVSGYKFSPDPQIDFGKSGPFSYLTGVVLSRHPLVVVTVVGPNAAKIAKLLEAQAEEMWDFSFYGAASEDYKYAATAAFDPKTQSVELTFKQAASPSNPLDATAWVVGVYPEYPVA